MKEPRPADPHLLGRLESFGDLVFGFVVPTMAVNLKVPNRPEEMVHSRKELVLFGAGFLFLCVLWLRHHRAMRRFFVPDPLGILIVFAILGTVALYGYPFQLYLRFPDDPLALRAYAWGFAWLCFLYAAMIAYGRRRAGAGWNPSEAREARRALVANAVMGVGMIAFPFAQKLGPLLLAVLTGVGLTLRLAKPWIDGASEQVSS